MAMRGQGERTYRAKSDASTDPSPCLMGSEEEHHHITHTQFGVHTNSVTKPAEREGHTKGTIRFYYPPQCII